MLACSRSRLIYIFVRSQSRFFLSVTIFLFSLAASVKSRFLLIPFIISRCFLLLTCDSQLPSHSTRILLIPGPRVHDVYSNIVVLLLPSLRLCCRIKNSGSAATCHVRKLQLICNISRTRAAPEACSRVTNFLTLVRRLPHVSSLHVH